ncbi:hypothetical protein JYU34_019705 [Plutella xylostella]|uniref:Uncharacterized protein n=1 Tax=Plutella xylostella TaxID=51655 RepID=A0ABQ7PV45_PLUXY|nr:hypothetical protein JYU34_019705 [Plutella xylostella]
MAEIGRKVIIIIIKSVQIKPTSTPQTYIPSYLYAPKPEKRAHNKTFHIKEFRNETSAAIKHNNNIKHHHNRRSEIAISKHITATARRPSNICRLHTSP